MNFDHTVPWITALRSRRATLTLQVVQLTGAGHDYCAFGSGRSGPAYRETDLRALNLNYGGTILPPKRGTHSGGNG